MKAWRTGRDLSQAEAAKLLEISQAAYSNLEAGRVDAGLSTVAKAAEVTGLPALALLGSPEGVEAALRTLAQAGYRVTLEPLPAPQAPPEP